MSSDRAPVELLLLWHHHQPDYRSPAEQRSVLPWVRLHATKDYLDMARRLERFPGVRATFNFVPSLLDQLEEAAAGSPDALFEWLARDPATLDTVERGQLLGRLASVPPFARERWPELAALLERTRDASRAALADSEVIALGCWFLLAWLDPMFLDAPEAVDALAHRSALQPSHRDALLGLHARLLAQVLPAYRAVAEAGQVELSASAYYHPILPLLIDNRSARRAQPGMTLPHESFAAPEDARWHIERARERHCEVFGAPPSGMWPPEGSVSPEAAELLAASGVRWVATDEGVLWRSLPDAVRTPGARYQPWRVVSAGGELAMFFRDHELSDRIGFVYHRWSAAAAADDLIARLGAIGRDHAAAASGHAPLVVVALDGENCWEQYPDDGGPFLDALYAGLEAATHIRTVTPSQVLAERATLPELTTLHSGSWIDADFHIWIGHPEKNRAWDVLARTRRALVESGATPASDPQAWRHLFAAEGSDWFWWFGDDHYTADRALFDRLFREHLQAVFHALGLPVPAWLQAPIVRDGAGTPPFVGPIGFVSPTIDGRVTQFYEWHAAGRITGGAGGSSMHRAEGVVQALAFGFDVSSWYLRLDFAARTPSGAACDLDIEWLAPGPARVRVHGLQPGTPLVLDADLNVIADARCAIVDMLELAVPFEALALSPGMAAEFVVHVARDGAVVETFPAHGTAQFTVPDENFERRMWNA